MNKPEITPKLTLVAAAMATVVYSGQSFAAAGSICVENDPNANCPGTSGTIGNLNVTGTGTIASGTVGTLTSTTGNIASGTVGTLTSTTGNIASGTVGNLNVTGTGTMAGLVVTGASTADLAEGTPNTCAAPTATLTTNGQSINTGAGSVTTTAT